MEAGHGPRHSRWAASDDLKTSPLSQVSCAGRKQATCPARSSSSTAVPRASTNRGPSGPTTAGGPLAASQSSSYMLFSRSAYFFSTVLRRIFRLGVTSPSSTVSSLWQDLELLDRFPALELFVALRDVSLDQVMDFLGAGELFVGGIAEPLLLRPTLDRLGIEGDQRRDVLAAVAVHQNLADVGAGRLEHTFDLLRSHVLAAGGLDQVLLPVGDPQIALLVELADVPGREPAVLERLRRSPPACCDSRA